MAWRKRTADAIKESDEDDALQGGAGEEVEEDEDPELQVDFDATPVTEDDYHGVQMMLRQLFRTAVTVNMSELTELIIAQPHIGSILRVFDTGADDEEEEEEADADAGADAGAAAAAAAAAAGATPPEQIVYGVQTVLSMRTHAETQCMRQISGWVLSSCPDPNTRRTLAGLLGSAHVGFVVSERFVNIPPQIAVPQYQSLVTDILTAIQTTPDGEALFAFDYYLVISKSYEIAGLEQLQFGTNRKKKRRNHYQDRHHFYVNSEEEIFESAAMCSYTFQIPEGADEGGAPSGTDTKLNRTVFLIASDKFLEAIGTISEMLGQ